MNLKVKLLRPGAVMPRYAYEGDSGMDLCACLDEPRAIWPTTLSTPFGLGTIHGCPESIATGLAIAIPFGYEAQIRPRSSLSIKGIVAAFGTIDSGYTGEMAVVLYNLSEREFVINPGDRIAQLVIAPVARVTPVRVDELPQTSRGGKGFGSSGR